MLTFKIIVLVIIIDVTFTENIALFDSKDAPNFVHQESVEIKIISHRNNDLLFIEKNGTNAEEIDIIVSSKNNTLVLNLYLHKYVILKGPLYAYQKNGETKIEKPSVEKFISCHYKGKIRGNSESWVLLSTCEDLSGIIFDGHRYYQIERNNKNRNYYSLLEFSSSFLYNLENDVKEDIKTFKNRKKKRSASTVLGTNYLELILVLDNSVYRKMDSSKHKSIAYASSIAHILHLFYSKVEIFIVVVGVVVWTEKDEIVYDRNQILNNFNRYCQNKLQPLIGYDSAQLVGSFELNPPDLVGLSFENQVCSSSSVGVNKDQRQIINLVLTIAHEIGHNLGLDHYDKLPYNCYCPENVCIMVSVRSGTTSSFSNCSIQRLNEKMLMNKPSFTFINSSICGNKIVEPGEDCDCGNEFECHHSCCNTTSCRLTEHSNCATGDCCDLKTCKLKPPATTCRPSKNECDLPEYCNGNSEFCPFDTFKLETETCADGKSYCHRGFCLKDGGTKIWRDKGFEYNPNEECYAVNSSLVNYENICHSNTFIKFALGMNKTSISNFVTCKDTNYETLELDSKLYVLFSRIFFDDSTAIACNLVMISDDFNIEPVVEMCNVANCTSMSQFRSQVSVCPQNCYNRGWCNNKGECHCFDDYEPTDCYHPGTGGSLSSGHARDPNAYRAVQNALYIFFCGAVPLAALIIGFIYYYLGPKLKSIDKERPVQIRAPLQTFVRVVSKRLSSTFNNNVNQPRMVNPKSQLQTFNPHRHTENEFVPLEVHTNLEKSTNFKRHYPQTLGNEFSDYTNVNIQVYNKCKETTYANIGDLSSVSQYSGNGQLPTSSKANILYENLEKSFDQDINVKNTIGKPVHLLSGNTSSNFIETKEVSRESVKFQKEFQKNLQNSFGKDAIKKNTKPQVHKKPILRNKGNSKLLVRKPSDSQQKNKEDDATLEQPSVKDIIKQFNLKK